MKCSMLTAIVFVLFSLQSVAQSTEETSREAIINEARKQLVKMTEPEGDLTAFCLKNKVVGDFVVDLTLGYKGQVLTVFMVSSTPENIQNQNALKSRLTDLRFEGLSIAKKERIKFRHTLIF